MLSVQSKSSMCPQNGDFNPWPKARLRGTDSSRLVVVVVAAVVTVSEVTLHI